MQCEVILCDECFEKEHDENQVKNLREHLVQRIEEKLGNDMYDGLVSFSKLLDEYSELNQSMFPNLEVKYNSVVQFVENSEAKRAVITRYFSSCTEVATKYDVKCGTSLLLEISEMGFTIPDSIYHPTGNRSCSTQVDIPKIDAATQTDNLEQKAQTSDEKNPRSVLTGRKLPTVVSYKDVKNSNPNQNPKKQYIRSFDIQLTLESRRPAVFSPSKLIDLDKFELQVFAFDVPCENHKHLHSCGESKLYLKVKRTWKPSERKTSPSLLDEYQITLMNKLGIKIIVSDWVDLDGESSPKFINFSALLDPQKPWLDYDRIRLEFTVRYYLWNQHSDIVAFM